MPLDNLWLDIQHTDANRYFTFHEENFEGLHRFLKKMEEQKKRVTAITDPHIKVDGAYPVFADGLRVKVAVDK